MESICWNWEFTDTWSEAFALGQGTGERVDLPHAVREIPLHYADPADYAGVFGYRREIPWQEGWAGKRIFVQFDGAAHVADLYCNGVHLLQNRCGYTAFRAELTEHLREGQNLLAVKLDTREDPEVPPFGFVVDYLGFGGLYREAWLDVKEDSFLADVFVTSPSLTCLEVEAQVENPAGCTLEAELTKGGRVLARAQGKAGQVLKLDCPGAKPWSVDHPVRYSCQVKLVKNGKVLDSQVVKTAFRTAQFQADGFYLNGEKLFLRGLNRHQSWPYVGYAVPAALQREDARILKEELGCNAVRTSHYPQSHHFLDACDELGLLVVTEIPGWQHVGQSRAWQDQVLENTRQMVLQYRNHPSIILWGVRINESQDQDTLYTQTNAIARALDPTRATTGVRYIEKSHLLEDVYGYNDFSHTGDNPGCKGKRAVTEAAGNALLICEHNGHMFPTKSFDPWQKRQEQALRHARVLSDAAADGDHVGCFGWCMFDYPTHKDFGSGDRVCYHGVMDAFRNPKTAAALYASQQEAAAVLVPGNTMQIGDNPGGTLGQVAVFTNAQQVKLYKNDVYVTDLAPGPWTGLPHSPRLVTDTIGCLLQSQEGFPKEKADLVRQCLLAVQAKGLAGLTPKDMARMAWCMVRWGMSYADALALYGKYVGNWGAEATRWRFDAVTEGKVVASCTCCPSRKLRLEVRPSHTRLKEGDSYDMAALRIRILEETGNPAPYAQLPVEIALEGPGQLVGPALLTAEGGMTGTYVRTCGVSGTVTVTVKTPQTEPVTVILTVLARP